MSFFKKFAKYTAVAVGIAVAAATIATGVGAILGVLGTGGIFGSTAIAGVTGLWSAVGTFSASVGSTVVGAIGLTGATTATTTAVGASVIGAGILAATATTAGVVHATEKENLSDLSKKVHNLRNQAAQQSKELDAKAKAIATDRAKLGKLDNELGETESVLQPTQQKEAAVKAEQAQLHNTENNVRKRADSVAKHKSTTPVNVEPSSSDISSEPKKHSDRFTTSSSRTGALEAKRADEAQLAQHIA